MIQKVSETFQEFFLRHDPGLAKLVAAIRGTAAVISSFFLLTSLANYHQQSPLMAFLGVIISLMTSLLVSDPLRKQQKVTMLMIGALSPLTLSIGVFLSTWHWLQVSVLLGVVYVAVFLRQYGPRGFAVGMLIFMAYFSSLFFPLHAAQLPWAAGSIIVAVALTYVIRFYVLPDRPRLQLRLARLSFRLQLIRTLKKISVFIGDPNPQENFLIKLQPELRMMNLLSAEIETRIASEEIGFLPAEVDHFRTQLFELELSIRRTIETSWIYLGMPNLSPKVLELLRRDLWKIAEIPWDPGNANSPISSPAHFQFLDLPPDSKEMAQVQLALREIRACWVFSMYEPGENSEATSRAEPALGPTTLAPAIQAGSRFSPAVLTSLQATLATGLATAIGTFISTDRWYWASVAAFVVITGAARGEAVTRAILRVIGTVLGLVAGFFLAYAIKGHHGAEGTLIFFCVFLGIYLARVAYGFWTAMWFTLLLALFYDFLGQMTIHILVLRLEETFVGALMSGLVSFYIFPTSTRKSVRLALIKLFDSAAQVLREVPQRSASPFARRELIRRIRTVDQEMFNVRTAAGPLQGKIIFSKGNEVQDVIHDTSLLTHYVRRIATSFAGELTEEQMKLILEVAQALQSQSQKFSDPPKKMKAKSQSPVQRAMASRQDTDLKHWSNRISQLLESINARVS
jgi:uncharacterized membrane protein YccC